MKGKIYNEKTGKWISGGAAQLHIIKKVVDGKILLEE